MGKESDLYDPLNTKTLGGDLRLDVDTYENVQDNIHLEGVNRKLLELTDLIGRVTNNRSDSGPIPQSQVVITSTVTSTGPVVLLTPEKGEVWQYIAGSRITTTNPSGNVTTELDIYDATNDVKVMFLDQSSSSTSDFPLIETNFAPIYISYPFVFRANTEGTFDSTTSNYSLIRVR
jgi:hypothetical protein